MEVTHTNNSTPGLVPAAGKDDDVRNDVINKVTSDDEDVDKAKVNSTQKFETTGKENVTRNSMPAQDIQVDSTGWSFRKGIELLRRRYGIVLALLAPIFFSFQATFVAVLTETLDSFQVVFMHVPPFMMCSLLLVLYARVRPPKDIRHYLWLLNSGSTQAANGCFFALAITYIPAGDAVAILYTAVIQVGFFSRIILKEPMRLFDLLFAILAFGGVIFIARPPFLFNIGDQTSSSGFNVQGVLFALAGSSTMAMFFVFNRKLSKLGINSFFCMFSNATMTVITAGVITLILQRWRWPTLYEWLFAMLAGASYIGAHMTMFYALKVETATLVTVLCTVEIVLIFVWQVIFLHLPPFWTSYIGAILILTACIAITLKKKSPPSQTNTTERAGT